MSDVLGKWEIVGKSGVVGVHSALLHTGQILFYGRPEDPSHKHNSSIDNGLDGDDVRKPSDPDITLSTVVDLIGPNAFKPQIVQVEHNPFCSGLTFLPDGRLFVAGGDKKYFPKSDRAPVATKFDGRYSLQSFTPNFTDLGHWEQIGMMSDARWYPTCTLMPDGRVMIISGYLDDMAAYNNQNPTCEFYPPSEEGPQYLPPLVSAWPHDGFPFVFVLPYGSIFLFVKDCAYNLRVKKDKHGRDKWMIQSGAKLPQKENLESEPAKQYPNSATAVLLPLLPENAYSAEVLLVGGGGLNVHTHWGRVPGTNPVMESQDVLASNSCFKIALDPFKSSSEWQRQSSMNNPRVMPDAVLLPDGTVLVVNGVSNGFAGGNAGTGPALPRNGVKDAELFNPVNNTWQTLAGAACTRLYHSTALLLPDARVLVAGSDHQVNRREDDNGSNENIARSYEYQIEVFEPPYLFFGTERAIRPVIKVQQQRIAYEQPFEVEVDDLTFMHDQTLRVSLLRPGSVTHGNNMSQRYVGLNILDRTSTGLTLEAPPNANVAPPGYYMLFLIHNGIPSEAQFIQLLLETSIETTSNTLSTSNMVLWLQADVGLETDDSDNVLAWFDSSGHGNNVFLKRNQGENAVQRPPKRIENELNSYPVVRFFLTMNWESTMIPYGACLESDNHAFLPGITPYTVFLVAHPWPPTSTLQGFGGGDAGWGDLLGWGDYTNPNSNAFVGLRLGPGPSLLEGSALPKVPGTASILNYWNNEWQFGNQSTDPLISLLSTSLIEVFYDGVFTGMRLNGQLIKKDNAPGGGRNTGNGPLTLGLNGGQVVGINGSCGAFFRGDIAEVIIYERSIEGKERYKIQEYLRNKYALW